MIDIIKLVNEFIATQKLSIAPIDLPNFMAYKATAEAMLPFLSFLKESEDLRFTVLTDLFGADFPDRPQRFEIVYNLLSLKLNRRLLIKIETSEDAPLPSAFPVFSVACWYEREIFDMYGVSFEGNPDMRRILTDYGFIGHPLRKDFPLTGHIQLKYDEVLKKVIYEPVKLEQEYRDFDFSSSWQGPNYVLPGDEKA